MLAVASLTSARAQRDLCKRYALGVNGYVVKPVAFDEFVGAIRQIFRYRPVSNEPPPECMGKFK